MRDLDESMARWRAEQAASTTLSVDALDELEEHLRESAAHLMESSLDADEALLVAERRLGQPRALESEFQKATGPVGDRRLRWMLAGVVAALVVPMFARFAGRLLTLVGFGSGLGYEWVMTGAPLVGLAVLVAAAVWVLRLPSGSGAVSRFIDGVGAPGASGSPGRRAAIVAVAVVVGVYAATTFVNIGIARFAAPEEMGYAAIGMRLLGLVLSAVLPVAAVVALGRRAGRHSAGRAPN